jgi:excisionase family DNA binding protein
VVVPHWLSIKQAATYMSLSQDHVRRAVLGGTLPASNVGTPDRALYRISREAIDRWMQEREAGAILTPRQAKVMKTVVSRHFGEVTVS